MVAELVTQILLLWLTLPHPVAIKELAVLTAYYLL
ncbi:MAG: hypothetical protein ACJAQ6_002228 [Arenicella sp.]|jgi:hypothetical protein